MCGFVGIIGDLKIKNYMSDLKKSINLIGHRGPDHKNFFLAENYGVAFTRLSIQDLSKKGNQPMSSQNNRYIIVFNGEIYNFKILKKKLQNNGIVFSSSSDTEVLLYLYQIKKEKMLNDIEGMFSIVIYDKVEKSVFLARDRFGIKPLYYINFNNILVFASEVKAFLPLINRLNIPWSINKELISEYLSFRSITGKNTLIKSVKSLSEGHYGKFFKSGKVRLFKYYSEKINNFNNSKVNLQSNSIKSYEDEVDEALYDAVESQMISDAPIGLSLSGGLDSSLLLSYMSQISQKKIHTYTVRFTGLNKKEKNLYDETHYAKEASKIFDSNLKIVEFNSKDNLQLFTEAIWYNDFPLSFPHSPAIIKLAREASKDVKVLLGGEGADEVFGGYNTYQDIKKPQKKINIYSEPNDVKKLLDIEYFENKERINKSKLIRKNNINTLILYYLKTKLISLEHRLDKMSMAGSVEFRVPYLNEKLFHILKKLPVNLKSNKNFNKYILKKIAERYFPKKFIYRKKNGFSMPINNWMKKKDFMDEYVSILDEKRTLSREIYDTESIQRLLKKFKDDKDTFINSNSGKIWSLINLELWIRYFIEDKKSFI